MKINIQDIQKAFVKEYFNTPRVARKMTSKDTTGEGLIVVAGEDITAGDLLVMED